jgi:hypothetical protein
MEAPISKVVVPFYFEPQGHQGIKDRPFGQDKEYKDAQHKEPAGLIQPYIDV